jgi:general nucleoside transport system ATP-binding protein
MTTHGMTSYATETEHGAPGLEAVSITKRFGSLTALDDVSLRVRPGSFHALLGENGAGKSTLVKCVMGYYLPDAGQVILGDRERSIASPRDAHALGLGMVYQHFTLVPNMTVAENLVLSREHIPPVIDWSAETAALARFFETTPFRIPLDAPVTSLAAGEKQKVEILKQLHLRRRFLILDEPTSVLTPAEADEVLGLLHDLTRKGEITVLMITHKFREVLAFADEVSVLRRGRYAGGGLVKDLGANDLARLMVGTDASPPSAERTGAPGTTRLELREIKATDDAGHPVVRNVSLAVRSREIVGIAGVSGNGQKELVEVIAGQRRSDGGEIRVHGEPYHATRAETRRHKLFCLPEEPLRNACVPRMSVAENLMLRDFDQAPCAAGGWWLRPSAFRTAAERLIARYRVKTPSPDAPVGTLSGGNVQRAVLARELGGDVEVLIAANPCFGLDFAAIADIHDQIRAARNRGAAVLLVSEDLDELLELADRLVVMQGGRLVYETPAAAADRTVVGRHMAGH